MFGDKIIFLLSVSLRNLHLFHSAETAESGTVKTAAESQ